MVLKQQIARAVNYLLTLYKRKDLKDIFLELRFVIINRSKNLLHKWFNTLPLIYNIGISSICNLNCRFCSQSSYSEKGLVELERIRTLIYQIPQFSDITIVDLGESLLHKNLVKILKLLKQRHARVHLFTNGTVIVENMAEVLLYCDRLIVSIDSVDEEKVKFLRRNSDLSHLRRVLLRISTTKRKKKIKNCELTFNITISAYNYAELWKILYFLEEVAFERVTFNLIEDWNFTGKERKKVLAFEKIIRRELKLMQRYCSKHKIIMEDNLDFLFRKKEPYNKCRWVDDLLVINWRGDILPCCLRRDYRIFQLGNVYQKSLKELWSSQQMRDFRRKKREGSHFICKNCNWYH